MIVPSVSTYNRNVNKYNYITLKKRIKPILRINTPKGKIFRNFIVPQTHYCGNPYIPHNNTDIRTFYP